MVARVARPMKLSREFVRRRGSELRRSTRLGFAQTSNARRSNKPKHHRRIAVATTVDVSLGLLVGFPELLKERGWDVHMVSSGGPRLHSYEDIPGITPHVVKMAREPSPLSDVVALVAWVRLLRRLRPDVLYVGTPKASLLACTAGWLTRVPVRVYLLRGLRAETESGLRRKILVVLEFTTMKLATSVVSISRSLARVAAETTGYSDIALVGGGSSNGINLDQYHRRSAKNEIEERKLALGISLGTIVIGFVGRIAVDKGIEDILNSVDGLLHDGLDVHLLLVGGREDFEVFDTELARLAVHITETGSVGNPEAYLELMDIFVMPSRREGFCNAILEAAAMEVPVVAARSTGIIDAVQDGVTGLLFDPYDVAGMNRCIQSLINDDELRHRLTTAGRDRVRKEFDRGEVQAAYVGYLEEQCHV